MFFKEMLFPEGIYPPWPFTKALVQDSPWFICWSSLMLIAFCFTFSLVIQMKLTYHPTLELAPNAICLRKCWTRAWIEITFSLTSWPTCTVLDSSFGRLLGDVYQEVSNSDTVGAITDSLFLTGSQSYHFFHKKQILFFSLFLFMQSQFSQEMIFHILELSLTASFLHLLLRNLL